MRTQVFRLLLGGLLALPLSALAQAADAETPAPITSDWLELVVGHKGEALGTEVRSVEEGGTTDSRTITLAIPKEVFDEMDEIEEVVVVGRRPEEFGPLIEYEYEWVRDYEKDYYGLIIRLDGAPNWPLRLFMNSDSGFIR